MYELIKITDDSYYIQSPSKVGLVKLNDSDVCLIDSGNDKDAGRKIRKVLDANEWTLKAIYNTHSHADHIGGNKYLQGRTGCKIYASEVECDFTRSPILEPTLLYGGFVPKDLKHKLLFAQGSEAEVLTKDVLPEGFEIIELPGHCLNMVGYKTPDDVYYLADCISSKEILDKYKIVFLYDVEAYLKTLEYVKTLSGKMFVPAHCEPMESIEELAQYNIDKTLEVAENILSFCEEYISFEDLLKKIFDSYGLKMNFEQNVLIGSTVRSYLSWLKDKGEVEVSFEGNILKWKKA